jgi:hypothetical protein
MFHVTNLTPGSECNPARGGMRSPSPATVTPASAYPPGMAAAAAGRAMPEVGGGAAVQVERSWPIALESAWF